MLERYLKEHQAQICWDDEHIEQLRDELETEKCSVEVTVSRTGSTFGKNSSIKSSGEIPHLERVLNVEAVELKREEDGMIFVNVGRWEGSKLTSRTCKLPGKKRGKREYPPDVAQDIIIDQLPFFAEFLGPWSGTQQFTEISRSDTVGLDTRYVRTVHYASLLEYVDDIECESLTLVGSICAGETPDVVSDSGDIDPLSSQTTGFHSEMCRNPNAQDIEIFGWKRTDTRVDLFCWMSRHQFLHLHNYKLAVLPEDFMVDMQDPFDVFETV